MKNFTKEERKQIIKESLKKACIRIMLVTIIAIFVALVICGTIPKSTKPFDIPVTITFFVLLSFFEVYSSINDEKKYRIRKKVDEIFERNCVIFVIPLWYDAYDEFFTNLSTLRPVQYYAYIKDDKVVVLFKFEGDIEKSIFFDEIEKEQFLKKYKIVE